MNIISNYKRINIFKKLIKIFFNSRKRSVLSIISFEIFIVFILGLNFKYIYRASKYIRNYEISDISLYLKELEFDI